jgi:predicted MFS family arabinose efflux permease
MGYLSDRSGPLAPMIGSTICSSFVVLCVWGFSNTFPSLLIFGLLYRLFAGGFSVLYCRFVTALTDKPATGLWLYSIFEFQRGVGNLIGGSVSGILVKDVSIAAMYSNLILFVGIAFLASSLGGLSYWVFKGHRPSL